MLSSLEVYPDLWHSRAAATRLREVRLQGYCGYNAQALGSTEFVVLTRSGPEPDQNTALQPSPDVTSINLVLCFGSLGWGSGCNSID